MFEVINTTHAPAPGGAYSQAVKYGSVVFTAGVGPMDPVSQQIVGTTIEEQTRQVMDNLAAILKEAGLSMTNVVKTTVYLENLHQDFAGFNDVYREYFQSPFPVRTTVGATLKHILVEIDMVAVFG